MKDLRIEVEKIILEAGKIFTETTIDKNQFQTKGFADFVTEVDYKIEEFLVEELSRVLPGSNIITEESKENSFNLEEPTWIIDPIDGTTNFIYNYQHSAISVCLCVDKKPYMGLIYNPALKELFSAEAGRGAFLNGKRISVSSSNKLLNCIIGFGTTPYDRSKADDTFRLVNKVYKACRDVRRTGSAALDIAYVAAGRMDGFFEIVLQPWDFAAGIVILKEAGGRITDFYGDELNVLRAGSIVAANSAIHEELRCLID